MRKLSNKIFVKFLYRNISHIGAVLPEASCPEWNKKSEYDDCSHCITANVRGLPQAVESNGTSGGGATTNIILFMRGANTMQACGKPYVTCRVSLLGERSFEKTF